MKRGIDALKLQLMAKYIYAITKQITKFLYSNAVAKNYSIKKLCLKRSVLIFSLLQVVFLKFCDDCLILGNRDRDRLTVKLTIELS